MGWETELNYKHKTSPTFMLHFPFCAVIPDFRSFPCWIPVLSLTHSTQSAMIYLLFCSFFVERSAGYISQIFVDVLFLLSDSFYCTEISCELKSKSLLLNIYVSTNLHIFISRICATVYIRIQCDVIFPCIHRDMILYNVYVSCNCTWDKLTAYLSRPQKSDFISTFFP